MAGTVLVTGGSGYIGGFLIRQLVAEGWTVRTTIRNLGREAEVRKSLGVDDSKLTFFAADLENDAGWAEAMAGCTHLAHVASPFPSGVPRHEDDLIVPAREGALRALRFAKAAGVKRVVLTSSAAAIAYGHEPGRDRYTEKDWTNIDSPIVYPYAKSKTIAERAARDWVAAEGGDMEFCTVNPAAVLGPLMSKDFSTSIELVKRLMDGGMPAVPDVGFGIVDVRDIADLHVRALNAPNMAGERFIGSGPFYKFIDVAHVLKERLGERGKSVPTAKMPGFVLRIMGIFSPVMRQVVGELGRIRDMDATHAKEILGWVPRPAPDSIMDTAHSLIEHGIVKA